MPFHPKMAFGTYQAMPGLSHSELEASVDSLAAYRWYVDHPEDRELDTDALVLGRLMHAMVLEPATVAGIFGRFPDGDGRKAEVRDAKAAVSKAGLKPIRESDWLACEQMAEAVLLNPAAKDIIDAATGLEVSAQWTGACGPCKGRVDIDAALTLGHLSDLKSDIEPNPSRWAERALRLGYIRQAAWYCDGWAAVTAEDGPDSVVMPDFSFIVVPKEPPYAGRVWVARVPKDMLEVARAENQFLSARIRKAIDTATFPGYNPESALQAPAWYRPLGQGG